MARFKQVSIVAQRELVERSRSVVFRISLAGMALLIVGGIVALAYFGGQSDPIEIGLAGDVAPGLEENLVAVGQAVSEDIELTTYDDRAAAESAVGDGDVEIAIVDSSIVISNSGVGQTVSFVVTEAINATERRLIADELGLSDVEVAAILAPADMSFEQLEEVDPDEDAQIFVAYIGSLLLFVTIIMFGQFVAMGIVEEKQNRVVEVVLSRIDATSLLLGKVVGIGLLGLLQVGVFVVAGIVTMLVVPSDAIPDFDLSGVGIPALIGVVVWFILGYLLYSFLYAAFGATVSRQEDLQGVAYIPALLLMPGYFIVSVSLGGDVGIVAKVASFVPFWTPLVMPLRINTGNAAWWEVAIAVALVVATIVVTVWLSARVYRGAALRTGGKVKLTDALRGSDT